MYAKRSSNFMVVTSKYLAPRKYTFRIYRGVDSYMPRAYHLRTVCIYYAFLPLPAQISSRTIHPELNAMILQQSRLRNPFWVGWIWSVRGQLPRL